LKRKKTIVVVIAVVIASISFAATYAYANYFGSKTVLQTSHDKDNCRQGNVLDRVDRQARFTVLSTCKTFISAILN
jgi:CHAT domain-containing protein